MPNLLFRLVTVSLISLVPVFPLPAQESIVLKETFNPDTAYHVELKVKLSGRLALPQGADKLPATVSIVGSSLLSYDERPLESSDTKTHTALRAYRDIQMQRTVGDREQKADIRPEVRRMVVLRNDQGKKVPFSPDGPLTWGEIDVVRTDLFSPVLVTGLLPQKPVRPGDRWAVSTQAVTELTDLNPIIEGGLTAEFTTVVSLNGTKFAKLGFTGTVTGTTDDGPSRQTLDGTVYFDLDANRLSYLNLNGRHELLSATGKVNGRIEGSFVMNRGPAKRTLDLSRFAVKNLTLTPNADNTLLRYDNPELGIEFLYPRRWRIGAVQGKQITVDESSGGGILITVESADRLPSIDQYQQEIEAYLRRQNWTISASEKPRRVSNQPRLDRFAMDAEVNKQKVKLEYAVVSQSEGGATVAARLPWEHREELAAGVDQILRSIVMKKFKVQK